MYATARPDLTERSDSPLWHYRETGSGTPLILLHGIGMSHAVWSAVMPYLESAHRVIAFDIPGFGRTPPLSGGTPPTVANLVTALSQSLDRMGLTGPLHFAGNSLGGCMALEAGRRGMATSVIAISPIGLWEPGPAPHVKYVFRCLRRMSTRVPGFLKAMVRVSMMREIALAVPLSVGSRRMPASDAIRAVDDLAESTAFEQTFENTLSTFSGRDIAVPLTVVFGDRDWILTPGSRHRDALPAHTRWLTRKGWGHAPMWADPVGVSELILESVHLAPFRRTTV